MSGIACDPFFAMSRDIMDLSKEGAQASSQTCRLPCTTVLIWPWTTAAVRAPPPLVHILMTPLLVTSCSNLTFSPPQHSKQKRRLWPLSDRHPTLRTASYAYSCWGMLRRQRPSSKRPNLRLRQLAPNLSLRDTAVHAGRATFCAHVSIPGTRHGPSDSDCDLASR